jgi:N-acetyl-gamma-glutamyl-phosphate reductase
MFCSVDEDVQAYGLLDHRHTPEIEQEITAPGGPPCQVLFTPHLAPLNRGILATCYARPTTEAGTDELLAAMSDQYHDEQFVVLSRSSPSTKAALGTNTAFVTAHHDPRTNTVIALCAIDNLCKGASGGAVQAANVALGLDEAAGLQKVGLFP